MNNFKLLYSSSMLQMKQSISRSMFRFCVIVEPIMTAFIMYMIYKGQGYEKFISYVILGTAITSMWGSISYSSAGDIQRERFMGTLQIIFNSPSEFRIIMLGKVIGNTIWGTLSMILSIVFVLVAFSVKMKIDNIPLFMLSAVIGIISFIAVSMMLSALLAISRATRVLMNVMEYPVLLLCGIMFPIDVIPSVIRPIAYLLSPTYIVKLLRMSCLGIENRSEFLTLMVGLLIITTIYIIIARLLYSKIDKKAREEATLEVC